MAEILRLEEKLNELVKNLLANEQEIHKPTKEGFKEFLNDIGLSVENQAKLFGLSVDEVNQIIDGFWDNSKIEDLFEVVMLKNSKDQIVENESVEACELVKKLKSEITKPSVVESSFKNEDKPMDFSLWAVQTIEKMLRFELYGAVKRSTLEKLHLFETLSPEERLDILETVESEIKFSQLSFSGDKAETTERMALNRALGLINDVRKGINPEETFKLSLERHEKIKLRLINWLNIGYSQNETYNLDTNNLVSILDVWDRDSSKESIQEAIDVLRNNVLNVEEISASSDEFIQASIELLNELESVIFE